MRGKFLMMAFLVMVAILLSVLSFQGIKGDPNYFQNHLDTRVGGPFESSGSTSRYALTKSIVDSGSFSFDRALAKFASPDVSKYNGNYFSIFAPGVSFLAVPLFMIGESLGKSELFTYSLNIIFGLLNFFLIFKISRRLRINRSLSAFNGFVFLFATNALAYVGTLTQHHVSTALVLLAILNSLEKRDFFQNILFGFIFAAGLLVDIPNAFMMLPPLIFIISKHFNLKETKQKIKIGFKISILGLVLGLLPIMSVYGFYNHQLTGSYLKIGQFIGRTTEQNDSVEKTVEESKGLTLINTPYNPRLELNGFYILLFSDERGIFYFSPILLVGILGLGVLYRQKEKSAMVAVIAGSAMICALTYSMFGDPWGGWSFGARYMIPAEALLTIGIGVALEKFYKNFLFQITSGILLIYSVAVAVIGAITTTSVPPKVEAVHLQNFVPYTYQRGWDLIGQNFSNSLLYNTIFANKISVLNFYLIAVLVIILLSFGILGFYFFDRGGKYELLNK